ncbi:MAG: hypothetical protein U1E83_04465 [Methylotetracoccus sp.]
MAHAFSNFPASPSPTSQISVVGISIPDFARLLDRIPLRLAAVAAIWGTYQASAVAASPYVGSPAADAYSLPNPRVYRAPEEDYIYYAFPPTERTFQPFLWNSFSYDSNLFRLPNWASPDTNPPSKATDLFKSDFINKASVGTRLMLPFSRQMVEVYLRGDQNTYARNTNLDYTGWETKGILHWELGDGFNGTLGARYGRELAAFGNFTFTAKDLLPNWTYFWDGNYQIAPRWRVTGGVDYYSVYHTFDQGPNSRKGADYNALTGRAGVTYEFSTGGLAMLQYEHILGDYPYGQLNSIPIKGFDQDRIAGSVKYYISAKTVVEANLAYVQRIFTTGNVPNFFGPTWRLGMTYFPTAKTQVSAYGWHLLDQFIERASTFYTSDGAAIEPSWAPTEKMLLSARIVWETREYPAGANTNDTSQASTLTGGGRNPVFSAGVSWSYEPVTFANFRIGYDHGFRSQQGNAPFSGYSYDAVYGLMRLSY